MICYEYENGVFVPILFLGNVEKITQAAIGVVCRA